MEQIDPMARTAYVHFVDSNIETLLLEPFTMERVANLAEQTINASGEDFMNQYRTYYISNQEREV